MDESLNKLKDSAERIFYTALAGMAAVISQVQFEFEEALIPLVLVVVNMGLVWLRRHIGALPNPGEGLPGARIPSEPPAPNPPTTG